jgi:hypothetical protein
VFDSGGRLLSLCDVRASYKMVDGKAKVLQIDVTSP